MTVATKIMNETSTANIKQILTAFDHVITICENHHWIKTVTSEDIKIAFKMACFVEKSMNKFHEQNCVPQFLNTLKLWGESNNRVVKHDQKFYSKVCDHLLLNFFKNENISENIIDVAVRMYTSLFPKERLQSVLKDLIMTSASFEAIFAFTVANKRAINVDKLKYELIAHDWCKKIENDDKDEIASLINDSLASYKVETSLSTLIGVLSLNLNHSVTKLILDKILEKMLDRSILSKNFWLTLVKNVDLVCLREVCVHYVEFLDSYCNFLIYIGGMMDEKKTNDKVQWVSNPNMTLCPEITSSELESIITFLCQSENSTVKEYVINRLNEAQKYTDSSIWEHIRSKCL